jgi:phosphoribosyl-AMP cyclohydrolase / phosphoribosyl-ATP pyrophosphohydrolase
MTSTHVTTEASATQHAHDDDAPVWPTIDDVRFDAQGLVPAVLQDADSGEVLTVAYMNAESLRRTVTTRQTWLWSRSRGELWHKGATSGHTQEVVRVALDCDHDAVIVTVRPRGPACHTGARSCFGATAPTLFALHDRLAERQASAPSGSYTQKLLGDVNLRLKKLGEEATELALACIGGADTDVLDEAADVLYHTMVAVLARGLSLRDVARVLARRMR